MDSKKPNLDSASVHDTVDAIVASTQRKAFPLRREFIQQKKAGRSTPGPLAGFVTTGDRTALLLYFLALTKASTEPWDVALHSTVWARALDLPNPSSKVTRARISKAWTRLVQRQLVTRSRRKRVAEFTLCCEDGSGDPYTRPATKFVNIPHALWSDGPTATARWHQELKLPELAFLVIALSNLDFFPLPAERGPDYYGISADTLQRGADHLRRRNLLVVEPHRIIAPLAPKGYTYENRYTLQPPFGPHGKKSKAVSAVR